MSTKHALIGCVTTTLSQISVATAQPAWPPPYAAVEVKALPETSVAAYGVNNAGALAGSLGSPNLGFVWFNGEGRYLRGVNQAFASGANDINDDGWVVGWGANFEPNTVPTVWIDGEPTSLGTLGGEDGVATAINNLGHVVGWAENEIQDPRAFRWLDGQTTDLGTLGGGVSWAWGVNNRGQVVGHSFDPNLVGQRGFLWDNGVMIDLGTLPDGIQCQAIDINDLGQIVGHCQDADRNDVAFLWENGAMRSIHDNRLGAISGAASINNRGQVVGFTLRDDQTLATRAFIWDADNGMRDLQELCPPNMAPKRWNAGDINEHGQIAVSAQRGNPFNGGRLVSLFVTPVHPTLTLEAPSPGVAGVENTFILTGAAPGATVRFFYSVRGGGEIIPGCATRLNALQLANPTFIGMGTADENGSASITAMVPSFASGQTILFQAVVQGECAMSQLVVHQFE